MQKASRDIEMIVENMGIDYGEKTHLYKVINHIGAASARLGRDENRDRRDDPWDYDA